MDGHENEVKSVAWSSEGNYLATCSRDKNIWIWEMTEDLEFSCTSVLTGHTQDVKFVKWHPIMELLFSSSYDDSIKCWRYDSAVEDWMCSYTISGHESTVWRKPFYL